jgi:hypothetical protein
MEVPITPPPRIRTLMPSPSRFDGSRHRASGLAAVSLAGRDAERETYPTEIRSTRGNKLHHKGDLGRDLVRKPSPPCGAWMNSGHPPNPASRQLSTQFCRPAALAPRSRADWRVSGEGRGTGHLASLPAPQSTSLQNSMARRHPCRRPGFSELPTALSAAAFLETCTSRSAVRDRPKRLASRAIDAPCARRPAGTGQHRIRECREIHVTTMCSRSMHTGPCPLTGRPP